MSGFPGTVQWVAKTDRAYSPSALPDVVSVRQPAKANERLVHRPGRSWEFKKEFRGLPRPETPLGGRADRCGLGGLGKGPGPHRAEPPGEEPENIEAAPIGADSAAWVRNPDRTALSRQAKTSKHRGRADRCGLGGLGKGPGPHRAEPSRDEPERMPQSERLLARALGLALRNVLVSALDSRFSALQVLCPLRRLGACAPALV